MFVQRFWGVGEGVRDYILQSVPFQRALKDPLLTTKALLPVEVMRFLFPLPPPAASLVYKTSDIYPAKKVHESTSAWKLHKTYL